MTGALVGRDAEWARLSDALERAERGRGSLVLLAGEAGIGKTRLAAELVGAADTALAGAAAQGAVEPYGPVVQALRSYTRARPGGLSGCGPLAGHLALVMPELGPPAAEADRGTLIEAIRCALDAVVERGPAVLVLDDLQWSDDATLELLASLGPALAGMPLLAVGAYRSDEVPRGHPLRRLRNEQRRRGALDELALEPLDAEGTASLARHALAADVSASLARTLHDRTQGIPFFVEELAAALHSGGALADGRRGLELDGDVPVPDTVRDAVLMRLAGASGEARAAAEAAAVAGERLDLALLAELAGEAGLVELVERGLLVETEPGRAAFRHALARDAVYEDTPWLRRRALHRQLAERLEEAGAPNAELALHWLGARDEARARDFLLASVGDHCSVHAYRDAARAARRALESWPEGEEVERRVEALRSYGRCAELAGELAEAARAWRELGSIARDGGPGSLAEAERRIAGVYDLQGDRAGALASRRAAADAFAAAGQPGDAAVERLAAAAYLQSSGDHAAAVELASAAQAEAERAERPGLRARGLALEGVARAKRGEFERGLETVRIGLSLALAHELTDAAAEAYQRLGTVLETAGDYGGARDALRSALDLCELGGPAAQEHTCVACMAYVLRELGDWPGAAELARGLLQGGEVGARPAGDAGGEVGPGTRVVADGVLGSIHGFRGELRPARRLLASALDVAVRLDVVSMAVDTAAALAWVEHMDGDEAAAARHCDFLLERWERSEDRHYAVWGLRWASTLHGVRGDRAGAHACAEALARIASDSGHADALAALAHALGETALMEGDADLAVDQLTRALELHDSLEIPFERAQIELRAGAALAAAGDRDGALSRLDAAYRGARRLGARPLASEAARAIAALGESVEHRLGRRAAADELGGGLSPRELEVMRLVADGHTNREIAETLVVSPRTIDMHVRNILTKLDSRSRTEAAGKAREIGLLG
jgi:DNA-binding CsgD family transcriptional regulator